MPLWHFEEKVRWEWVETSPQVLGAKGWEFVPLLKQAAFFWTGSVLASWIQRPTSVSQPRFVYLQNSCKLLHSRSCWKRMKTSLAQSRQMAGGQTASVKGHTCFASECSCAWAHVATKKQAFKARPPFPPTAHYEEEG